MNRFFNCFFEQFNLITQEDIDELIDELFEKYKL